MRIVLLYLEPICRVKLYRSGRNIFENSDVRITPQIIPSDIICSLLSKQNSSQKPNQQNSRTVKSFQGDPIFLVANNSQPLQPFQTVEQSNTKQLNSFTLGRSGGKHKNRDPNRSPTHETRSLPRNSRGLRSVSMIMTSELHQGQTAGSTVNEGVTFIGMNQQESEPRAEGLVLVDQSGAVSFPKVHLGSLKFEGEDKTDDSKGTGVNQQTRPSFECDHGINDPTSHASTAETTRSAGATNGPTFDESRDADDEASSGKTSNSESDEFLRKISGLAEDAPIHHANLFRRPIEDFGLELDTSLGHKLLIRRVESGSNAFVEGLAKGDQILALNSKTVGDRECDMDFQQAIKLIRNSLSVHMIVAKCVDSYHKMPCRRLTVELRQQSSQNNSYSGLGLSIGKNNENKLVIKGINTGGVAFKDGRLKKGDQIVKISGVFTHGLSTDEVGKLLKNSGKVVKLEVLQPDPNGENLVTVGLKRSSKLGLGLGVAIYTSKLNETSTLIRNVLPQSPADKNPKLSLDDEIVSINGRETSSMNSSEILDMLKNKAISHYSIQIRPKNKETNIVESQKPKKLPQVDEVCCKTPFFMPNKRSKSICEP
ncbi:inaD-like protein isoform X2 [Symsagittifera roscoffensis]|uniref:inaD-like protein isoform X2 n=1 Tax=Symsagittifera roscoffensis TaxID=84072 RepID=UPI00307CA52E